MKKRRGDSSYQRKKRYIRPTPFFIIVCEGSVTEEDYFKSFPYYHSLGGGSYGLNGQSFIHKAVHIEAGAGQHVKVVEKADRVYKDFLKEYGTINPNEVWCVFDCDNDMKGLRSAVQAAKNKGFNAIYSIQCFELWYILHFQRITSPIEKKEYDKKISKFIGVKYTHGMRGMYNILLPYQELALNTAKQIWNEKFEEGKLFEETITNVHELVIALNQAYKNLKVKR